VIWKRERSRRGRADAARRARVILLLAAGETYTSITAKTGCSSRTIALWKRRFETDGVAGLAARHRGSKPTVLTPRLQARILAWTRRAPPNGATHWSTRSDFRVRVVRRTLSDFDRRGPHESATCTAGGSQVPEFFSQEDFRIAELLANHFTTALNPFLPPVPKGGTP
jgi:transposase